MTATLFAIRRADGNYYTHGYPGSWNAFPKLQVYQNKAAASRQLKALLNTPWKSKFAQGAEVVKITLVEEGS